MTPKPDVQVLLTSEAAEATTKYHIAADESSRSLCGIADPDGLFSSDVYRILPREQAERQGYELCNLCGSLADP